MSDIDWKKAPAWAKFAAMDESGAWYWYEVEPACADQLGMFCGRSARVEAFRLPRWQQSLSARDAIKPQPAEPAASVVPDGLPAHPVRLIGAAAAQPFTVEQYLAQGWTYDLLVAHGYAERIE